MARLVGRTGRMIPSFDIWQDLVFFFGQLLFFVALVPSMRSTQKPPLSSCLVTFVVLLTFVPANFTLHLYLATLMTVVTASAWGILTCQQARHQGFRKLARKLARPVLMRVLTASELKRFRI